MIIFTAGCFTDDGVWLWLVLVTGRSVDTILVIWFCEAFLYSRYNHDRLKSLTVRAEAHTEAGTFLKAGSKTKEAMQREKTGVKWKDDEKPALALTQAARRPDGVAGPGLKNRVRGKPLSCDRRGIPPALAD